MTSRTTGECTDTHIRMEDILMDDHTRMKMKIVMVNRRDIRTLFGITFANQQGHFTDECMSPIIYAYSNWVAYPKGDHVLEGHTSRVLSAAFSSDGYYLFTGSIDSFIIKWNLLNHESVQQWKAHASYILCLDYHRSGVLVSGSTKSIRIWNALTNELIHDCIGHSDFIRSVSVNRKGTEVVSGSDDETIRLWSVKSGLCLRVFTGHIDTVTGVCFDLDGSIVSCAVDDSVRVWDASIGKEIRRFSEMINGSIIDMSFNCDSTLLACVFSGSIKVYQWPTMEVMFQHESRPLCCDFHPCDPDLLAVPLNQGRQLSHIVLLNIKTKQEVSELEILEDVRTVRFSPDGMLLAVTGHRQSVSLFDLSSI